MGARHRDDWVVEDEAPDADYEREPRRRAGAAAGRSSSRYGRPAARAGARALGLRVRHFVGARPDGRVAVYQGVPWNLGGGVHLYREVYVSRCTRRS